jgi:ATP-dependent Clp protease adaptor protein ClpS
MSSTKRQNKEEGDVALEERTQKKLQRPRMYRVLLHNDDFTTMEFVVALLIHVFHHNETEAQRIMLHIHHHGIGVAGVFTFEIAETKVAQTRELAEKAEFPLLCTMEPDEQEEE